MQIRIALCGSESLSAKSKNIHADTKPNYRQKSDGTVNNKEGTPVPYREQK
jgi:hypothetical protein